MTGGPSAIPTLPPSENHESAVALRSPATLVAVLYASGCHAATPSPITITSSSTPP